MHVNYFISTNNFHQFVSSWPKIFPNSSSNLIIFHQVRVHRSDLDLQADESEVDWKPSSDSDSDSQQDPVLKDAGGEGMDMDDFAMFQGIACVVCK